MQPQSPTVLALHFGFSLIAFAAAVLAAMTARWPERTLTASRLGHWLRAATWGMAVYLYALIYTGAFIRHAAAAAACPSWPLCGPGAGPAGPLLINLVHRGAAGLALVLGIGLIVLYSWRAPQRRDLVIGGWALVAALGGQAVAGAYLVSSGWSLYGELLHAGVTAVVFAAAAYLCFRVSVGSRAAPGREPSTRRVGTEQPA
jgi:heme a synthase